MCAQVYPRDEVSPAPQLCGHLLSVGLSLKLVVTMLHVCVLCECWKMSVLSAGICLTICEHMEKSAKLSILVYWYVHFFLWVPQELVY